MGGFLHFGGAAWLLRAISRADATAYLAARTLDGDALSDEEAAEGGYFLKDAEPTTHVYFLLDREACQIKIGYSTDVNRRVRELRAVRKRDLELLGTIRGTKHTERALHDRFKPHRREAHEWYSSEIIADIVPILTA